ncbi:peptidoglycan-binding protein [Chryseobacterium lactis]|uniref:peptidoglycan-binding domain-containing protein n=1 Tax=Chryseobacterium lactis TaxID=1241981 RepID=UPI0016275B35|nr:peptidoglycan-binding domain-containing protein [Chryseobacterium lactis]
MSRLKKTFAPRATRSEAQTNDHKEDETKYEPISNQDAKISLAKTEVTQITYAPFRNRAFSKIEKGVSRIQFPDSGLHVLALNKALNALGHKVPENVFFGNKTKIALINFQQQNGITGSGIFDQETLLAMNKALDVDKNEKSHKKEETPSQEKEEETPALNLVTTSDEKVSLSVGIVPMTIQSDQEFFDFLNIRIFGKITDINWDIGKNSYKDYIGKETRCNVHISSLKKYLGITDQQWEDMNNKATASTSSALDLKESVEKYLEKSKAREAETNNRNILETQLYGLKDFYKEYIRYVDYLKSSATSSSNSNLPDVSPLFMIPKWKEELNKKAKKYGFKDLTDFENTVNKYQEAFRSETIHLAEDYMDEYEHLLYKEEIRLKQGDTIKQLYATFNNAEVGKNISEGRIKERAGLFMNLNKNIPEEHRIKTYYEGKKEKKAGIDKAKALNSPIFKDKTFNFDKLGDVNSQKEFEEVLFDFIIFKRENVQKVRRDLKDNPDAIYKQQELLQHSYQKQGVVKDNILDLIIQQKIKNIEWTEILKSIALALGAIVAIAVTWGAATPYVIAGTAVSLGISAYNVYEALDDYYKKDAAYEIGLLKEKPSLVWVVVAIAGAALDAASLAAVFRAAKPITEAADLFNRSVKSAEDIKILETSLARIDGLSEKVQANIVRQAELTIEFRNVAKELLQANATLNVGINPEALPKLIRLAHLGISNEILTFEKFLLELKIKKLIKSIDSLTDEELKIIKEAYQEAKIGSKTDELIVNKFPNDPLPDDGRIENFIMDEIGDFRKINGNHLNSGDYNFVITKENKLILGERHHLLANKENVRAAGSVSIKNGKIREINNLSGHFRPTIGEALRYSKIFEEVGVKIKSANLNIFTFKQDINGLVIGQPKKVITITIKDLNL